MSNWTRILNCITAHNYKFWQVQVRDYELFITWGKIGTKGVDSWKTYKTMSEAERGALKLIREKQAKGYVDTTPEPKSASELPASSSTSVGTVPVPAPVPVRDNLQPRESRRRLDVD